MSVGFTISTPVGLTIGTSVGFAISTSVCGTFCSRLLVGLEVEVDEQEQVRCQETASEQGSFLRARTVANVRQVGGVCGSKTLVS